MASTTILDLAAEIRDHIFELAVVYDRALEKPSTRSGFEQSHGEPFVPPLLLVCKRFHCEYLSIFHDVNIFRMSYKTLFASWEDSKKRLPFQPQRIRHLELFDYTPGEDRFQVVRYLNALPRLRSASIVAREHNYEAAQRWTASGLTRNFAKPIHFESQLLGTIKIKGLAYRLSYTYDGLRERFFEKAKGPLPAFYRSWTYNFQLQLHSEDYVGVDRAAVEGIECFCYPKARDIPHGLDGLFIPYQQGPYMYLHIGDGVGQRRRLADLNVALAMCYAREARRQALVQEQVRAYDSAMRRARWAMKSAADQLSVVEE